jgi:hypothetical protein
MQASAEFRSKVGAELLPRLRAFKPDLLFISAGFDGHMVRACVRPCVRASVRVPVRSRVSAPSSLSVVVVVSNA